MTCEIWVRPVENGFVATIDDETWSQFQTAMKEARAEIDAEPKRF